MNMELERKIEAARMLHNFCYTIRRNKKRPDLAAEFADREMQFKTELEKLERERAVQPELIGEKAA